MRKKGRPKETAHISKAPGFAIQIKLQTAGLDVPASGEGHTSGQGSNARDRAGRCS